MPAQLGDKLGPRLSRLILNHQLALRRQLAPLEATIAAAGTQKVIDRAGRETAEHYRDILHQLLRADPDMAPWLRAYILDTASGDHQWKSVAGVLGMTGVTGGLSTVLTNFMAPAVQALVGASPQMQIDQNAAAELLATRSIDPGQARQLAAQAGFPGDQFDLLVNLARTYPDAPTLYDLSHRGLISTDQLFTFLARTGVPDELIPALVQAGRVLITPADAALAVLRGNMSLADGELVAARNGMVPADFSVLIGNTGEPPALEEMLMLWRRGEMDTPTLERAILQSRVRNEWIPYLLKLAVEPPSVAQVLDALVQGQISERDALARYEQAGGDPTFFKTAYAATANAPAPVQLAELANRGIIPWDGQGQNVVSWQQGFLEGRWKDKWMPAFRALAEYHPPPREVATLVKEGGMTQDQALHLWQQAGLTPELAHMYWTAAHYHRTAALHHLAVSEIRQLYLDKAIDKPEAMRMLESVGWTEIDATWLLDLADMQLERSMLEKAITKIAALYIGHKLAKTAAAAALAALDVPASQAQQLIKTWDLELAANVRTLTPAEIIDAFHYSVISPAAAQQMLEAEGYTAYDAWLLLTVKNKGPIPDFPAPK